MSIHAVSRRSLVAGFGSVFAWSYAPRPAYAGRDPRLLVVVLRGGLDGLAAAPPLGDPDYARLRGDFGLAEKSAHVELDGTFALNSNMKRLAALYSEGHAIIVHAVATAYRGRSHFDGQDALEGGFQDFNGVAETGWLNRALQAVPPGDKLPALGRKGLAISPTIPVIMRGDAPVETWQPQVYPYANRDTIARLLDLYEARDIKLAASLREGAQVDELFMEQGHATAAPAAAQSKRPSFAKDAGAAAKLMSEPTGPRIGAMSFFGWDTHVNEGPVRGRLADSLTALDSAIGALRDGFGPVWNDTVVMIVTEFGRTARINGTLGTDHGTATVCYVLGGAVKGGRVVADWPGLSEKALYEGRDLAPTTDLRSVAKGVLGDFLGIGKKELDTVVFPDSGNVKAMQGLIA